MQLKIAFTFIALVVGGVAAQWDMNCAEGRTVMVHLFEWKWNAIADECERFLAPAGYCGVQISPPTENRVVWDHDQRPWWERYQPVSYALNTRSGTEDEFRSMVERCNAVGVRIYADIVVNHMCGSGGEGYGTGGCYYKAEGSLSFPCVPFSEYDFHTCSFCGTGDCSINSYNDQHQVRNCRLVGLLDLDQGNNWVQGKIQELLNRMIGYGVAGFRLDAMKHMTPDEMKSIMDSLNNLRSDVFGDGKRAFLVSEVIDLGGEAISSDEYKHIGRVTEFNYGMYLARNIRYEQLSYLSNFGEGWGYLMASGSALVFIDNHDNQRGHGAGGEDILTFRDAWMYKIGVVYMLGWPYGVPRVMSSFYWEPKWEDWIGPPHDDNWDITTPQIHEDGGSCTNDWVCEHRWTPIRRMVEFRNVAGDAVVYNWWSNGGNAIAFSRGNRAFLAINKDSYTMSEYLQTGLPAGSYCDVITGIKEVSLVDYKIVCDRMGNSCTGHTITVGGDGQASITIDGNGLEPYIAIHINQRL